MKTIFIVEDEADIQELISLILKSDHYSIRIFPNASEFKQALGETLPDLILLDIMLPDDNGMVIVGELKSSAATAHIPVLLMSAAEKGRAELEPSGAAGFIRKPFDIYAFKKKVEEHLT